MAAPLKSHVFSTFVKNALNRHKIKLCQPFITRNYAVGKPGSPNRLDEIDMEDTEFRVLVIPGHTQPPYEKRKAKKSIRKATAPPRYKSMNVDQDWTNVWPAAQTFKWSVVPFPVRQGMIEGIENDGIPPGKYANAELMKIPNFLHATPAHIKKHCAALKEYCTKWPEELCDEEVIVEHFPMEVITQDYVFDAPTPRDSRARKVTLNVKLSSLELDYHANDKILRLLGDRYNKRTDIFTIKSDRCPLRQQNLDFCMYVLTALYHEAWKVEPWESEKQIADMEKYVWDIMPSKQATIETIQRIKQAVQNTATGAPVPSSIEDLPQQESTDDVINLPTVQEYKAAVESLHNQGEDDQSLHEYKLSAAKLLGFSDAVKTS